MTATTKCHINVNNKEFEFDTNPGMTVFAALRSQKKYLPSGCGARGACGLCRIKIVGGQANMLTDNEKKLLSEKEMASGCRLGCQTRISGDLDITIPEASINAKEFKVTAEKIIPLTHDIKRFRFKLNDGQRINHLAGQFVSFIAKPHADVKTPTMRTYSLCNASNIHDYVDFIIRRVPKGVCTTYLFDHLKEGDETTIIGPFGDFYLRNTDAPAIWIAGGSGLSPFMGMLQDLLDKGIENRKIKLFFGAVLSRDLYYIDELKSIAKQHPWFEYIPALSGDDVCDACSEHGLVTDVVAKHIPDAHEYEAYLCGSPNMVSNCIVTLKQKGVQPDKIYYDKFGG